MYDTINGQNHVEKAVNKRGARLLAMKIGDFLVSPADIFSVELLFTKCWGCRNCYKISKKI